ncbi:MAG: hypothetical protein PHX07_04345 [Candidatus Marinimicrobia bacterium]|nr:hypothetical protein [Candidatus Neomarinimicrobiota bacterium]
MNNKYLFLVFLVFYSCGFINPKVISEKKIWNQDHTHYIHTIYYTHGLLGGHVSVLIDGKEYLRFETRVVLMGRWINENEIKIVSNLEPMKNSINKCPILIEMKVGTRNTDFVSDSLLQRLLDPRG